MKDEKTSNVILGIDLGAIDSYGAIFRSCSW